MKTLRIFSVAVAALLLASCGTSRKASSVIGGAVPAPLDEAGAMPAPMEDAAAMPMEDVAMPVPAVSAAEALVMNSVENQDLYIEIDRIVPRKLPQKETLDGYTISIKDGILKCYLPYIGEVRYSFSDENAIAIDANKVPVKTKVTYNPPYKKCYALVEFTFKSRYNSEVFYFQIDIFKNGTAYVRVESQYRDFINYNGHLEQRPVQKENNN